MTSNTEQARIIIERLQPLKLLEIMNAAPESREAILETIGELCEIFRSASPAERIEIVSHVHADISFLFIWFARRMSEKAVRESAAQPIWAGLIAIVLENFARDYRDSLIDVMLLYHSATKLGLNVEILFSEAASLAVNPDVALALHRFPLREPKDRSLAAFFFEESGEGDSFVYRESDSLRQEYRRRIRPPN
jgi:hypothetical protein